MAQISGEGNKVISPWERYDPEEEMSWNQALVQGAQNLPRSTMKAGGEIFDAVMNPIETGHTLLKLASGSFHLILPDEVSQRFDPEGKTEESQQMARLVGEYFKNKYKDEESIKHLVATDPASMLMDIATVLSGGGMAIGKTGQLTGVSKAVTAGNVLQKAGTYTDPLTATLKAGGATVTGTAIGAREIAGATSGTGGAAVGNLFDASRQGAKEGTFLSRGEDGQMATQALRGGGNLDNVLEIAMRDLDVMKKQKTDNYRANSELWKSDTSILDFKEITETLKNAENIVKYQGTVKNPAGVKALDELKELIDSWKGYDPKTHHTPEGMDALKQRMWAVVESVPVENATAKGVAQNVYHSVKRTIENQAPNYAKTMKDYSDALETIKQIEKTLSMNPTKGTIDTAIRKLNSIMRDNVNTNYGQRMKLARLLEEQGGEKFISELAGQQFSSLMPRNIQGAVTPGVSTVGLLGGALDPVSYVGSLAASSPRIVGETANLGGYIMGKLDKLPKPKYEGISALLEILYQTQAQMENKQNQ